jgi:hypothetical protein
VYKRSGHERTFMPHAIIQSSQRQTGAMFGTSVSLFGEHLVVGASGNGAAVLFVRTGSVWTEQEMMIASDYQSGSSYGSRVHTDGVSMVVAAHLHDGVATWSGQVYVYELAAAANVLSMVVDRMERMKVAVDLD